ncbi:MULTISPECIES: PH domain-containing protein [Legionella]|uniref:PH domain-containing protein n=1 Tax=Legionella septentrionalis TaxID=2498109 RepID=A0A3S0VBI1_9GAMM|nr:MULTISPECIES: PH domain-containing protein [Legionella]MCP0913968.1 PH domain-containing protein [Legionella sp. 27cVA30]RUQ90374.1 PH domain-containing protein [Legionella septentrionalis]RUR00025.1 PH domain-containing protein [Legionella septentrionalis]RUR10721.1 PH domain-containing protein [Legionella septentrionalis]RUR16526.1 PH domain-containing protein [Legionella septentrionalis]
MTDNNVIHQARLHWVLFVWPLVLFTAAVYVAMNFELFYEVSLVVAFFALIWLLMMWVTYQFSSLTINKKHVILRSGVLVRQTIDIPLNKIESIDIRQTILGSILRYGSLVITGTGGTRQVVNYINKPLTCRRYIEQLMNAE